MLATVTKFTNNLFTKRSLPVWLFFGLFVLGTLLNLYGMNSFFAPVYYNTVPTSSHTGLKLQNSELSHLESGKLEFQTGSRQNWNVDDVKRGGDLGNVEFNWIKIQAEDEVSKRNLMHEELHKKSDRGMQVIANNTDNKVTDTGNEVKMVYNKSTKLEDQDQSSSEIPLSPSNRMYNVSRMNKMDEQTDKETVLYRRFINVGNHGSDILKNNDSDTSKDVHKNRMEKFIVNHKNKPHSGKNDDNENVYEKGNGNGKPKQSADNSHNYDLQDGNKHVKFHNIHIKNNNLEQSSMNLTGKSLINTTRVNNEKSFVVSASQGSDRSENNVTSNRIPGHKIVISTLYRSGSSFIGDIFQHMPDTFYSYEPLMYLHLNKYTLHSQNDTFLTPNLVYYVNRILKCDLEFIVNESFKRFPEKNEDRDWWTMKAGFLGYNTTKGAQNGCLHNVNIVTKIIRAYYLRDLAAIMEHNVSVVHLVRDPRGTLCSMIKIWTKNIKEFLSNENNLKQNLENIRKHCHLLRENLHFIRRDLQIQSYKSKYLFVRYEDFALYPRIMIEKLFTYFGFQMSPEIYAWISNTTSGWTGNEYSTARNSYKAANEWRHRLPYFYIQIVQAECGDVITAYGYKLIKRAEQLLNTSYSLVSDIPKKSFKNLTLDKIKYQPDNRIVLQDFCNNLGILGNKLDVVRRQELLEICKQRTVA